MYTNIKIKKDSRPTKVIMFLKNITDLSLRVSRVVLKKI